MDLTLPIFNISLQSLIGKEKDIKPAKPLPSKALVDKASGLIKIAGHYKPELSCANKLKIPEVLRNKEEFQTEEVFKPPWRIPSLAG